MAENSAGQRRDFGSMRAQALFPRILPASVCVGLLLCVGTYIAVAVAAVAWPFGLDYAEGEVWEQALLIAGPKAYGGIIDPPWIGFEYPPLYPLIALALSHAWQFLAAVVRSRFAPRLSARWRPEAWPPHAPDMLYRNEKAC